jgi:FK506-binding nuclear protein
VSSFLSSQLPLTLSVSLTESRFEEINESEIEKKSLKRPRESEVSEKDGKAQAQSKLSKAEKKKLKKLKDESGAAVAVGAEAQNKQKKVAEPKKEEKEKKKDGESKPVQPKAAAQELAGGVKIVDSKKGTGPQAKKGNTVSMRYIGKLQNGNTFDSNTKGKPVRVLCCSGPSACHAQIR